MTTTHAARRTVRGRRPSRPTNANTSRAHAHRVAGARERKVTPAAPAVEVNPIAPVRSMRTPDADDHLAAYFRQLAEHELLTPEDERELSQGIEDTEILTWERVLARPDIVRPILALVEPNLEQPMKFPKLLKAVDDLLKSKR